MADPWQILRDGGLPVTLPSSGTVSRADQLAVAVCEAISLRPTGRDADALAAFVLAWRHHWPRTFLTELGSEASAVVDWATAQVHDPNRYLKLRRIAIENLAKIL
ncbi:MAG: hypothetical protein AB7O24_13440 [Kofleriaceae bacterium]